MSKQEDRYLYRVCCTRRDGSHEDVEMSDDSDANHHAQQLEADGARDIVIYEQVWRRISHKPIERWTR